MSCSLNSPRNFNSNNIHSLLFSSSHRHYLRPCYRSRGERQHWRCAVSTDACERRLRHTDDSNSQANDRPSTLPSCQCRLHIIDIFETGRASSRCDGKARHSQRRPNATRPNEREHHRGPITKSRRHKRRRTICSVGRPFSYKTRRR